MTLAQELHLRRVKDDFLAKVDAKYRRGAQEHGGEMLDYTLRQLLEFALEEAIDQVTYLQTAIEKLERSEEDRAA